jgi:hypothetical protein
VRAHAKDRRPLPFKTQARWLDLGELAANTIVTVEYPLITRKTTERVGGNGHAPEFSLPKEKRTFVATWRGNRVIRIDPPGTEFPIFKAESQPAVESEASRADPSGDPSRDKGRHDE